MTQRVFIVAKTIPKEVQGSIGYSLVALDAAFGILIGEKKDEVS